MYEDVKYSILNYEEIQKSFDEIITNIQDEIKKYNDAIDNITNIKEALEEMNNYLSFETIKDNYNEYIKLIRKMI